ncbi:hypothetical protein F5X68DRAFT_261965 [Plectosphaerella plurivora]|uniref:Uncharacterized protein n=1 Tax=Plectosphaerella plurivora TaxID=936078 RepID=A0A9P9A7V5_9PEZI|nr:hypothetical protein F5X68DRAFT_261965 [Plectosphaerella plurivora]
MPSTTTQTSAKHGNGGGHAGCVVMKHGNGGGHAGCVVMKHGNGGGHAGCVVISAEGLTADALISPP